MVHERRSWVPLRLGLATVPARRSRQWQALRARRMRAIVELAWTVRVAEDGQRDPAGERGPHCHVTERPRGGGV